MAGAIVPVLMAGGSGTRLWPLSRELYPKQLLRLTNAHSLLQNTALRAKKIPDALPPAVICGDPHRFLVAEQLREIGIADAAIVLEPEGRNTAPAAAVAALYAREKYGDDTQILLMAADHTLRDERAFVRAVRLAAKAAASGRLMTFGIKPTRPETGYGYLKPGPPIKIGGGKPARSTKGKDGAREVAAFIEKPDAAKARRLIRAGCYWNGGTFLLPVGLLLAEFARLEAPMLKACVAALARARRDLEFIRLDARSFRAARKESLDYAVMEKSDRIALVPLDAGWDDVGSWSFAENLPPTDRHGNRVHGDVWLHGVRNSVIRASSRLVAAIGIENHIVIETGDAVLVTTAAHAQEVKRIVASLKAAKRPEAVDHPKVYRPWGWYETVAAGPRFQVKRIAVKPGHKLSLQMHHKRAEHWVVVKGSALVTRGDQVFDLAENESTFIPRDTRHRLENNTSEPLEIIEVQSGAYLGEDDIVRFEDAYGRTRE